MDKKQITVLVIDSQTKRESLYRKLLLQLGDVRVEFVSDLRGGLLLLKQQPFDLTFVSEDIASARDCALLQAVRGSSALQALPVVVCTGASELVQKELAAAGASCCMAFPPQTVSSFVETARAALESPSMQKEQEESSDVNVDVKALVAKGQKLLQGELYADAARVYAKALGRCAELTEALVGLGRSFSGLGQFAKAARAQHKAVGALVKANRFRDASRVQALYEQAVSSLKTKSDSMSEVEQIEALGDPVVVATREMADDVAAAVLDEMFGFSPHNAALHQELVRRQEAAGGAGQSSEGSQSDATDELSEGGEGEVEASTEAEKKLQNKQAKTEEEKWQEKRLHDRIPLADFVLETTIAAEPFTIVNISYGGLCFKHAGHEFKSGELVRGNILDEKGAVLRKIAVAVRHVGPESVGGQFQQLSERQSASLEEIIEAELAKVDDPLNGEDDLTSRDDEGKIIIDLGMW